MFAFHHHLASKTPLMIIFRKFIQPRHHYQIYPRVNHSFDLSQPLQGPLQGTDKIALEVPLFGIYLSLQVMLSITWL